MKKDLCGLTRIAPGYYRTADDHWEIFQADGEWPRGYANRWMVRNAYDRDVSEPVRTFCEAKEVLEETLRDHLPCQYCDPRLRG